MPIAISTIRGFTHFLIPLSLLRTADTCERTAQTEVPRIDRANPVSLRAAMRDQAAGRIVSEHGRGGKDDSGS